MRILGLDVGERRIGVAICDPEEMMALPLTTLERREETLADIDEIVRREGVETVVVGLPLSLDGSLGRQAEQVQAFARALASQVAVPVEQWDERLSTVEAERTLRAAGFAPRAIKARRDAAAAAIILESYLDRRRGGRA